MCSDIPLITTVGMQDRILIWIVTKKWENIVKMKTLSRLGAAVAAAAVLSVGLPAVANADNGDGTTACVNGEICFAKDSPNTGTYKHFWYGSGHGGLVWGSGPGIGTGLQDSITMFRNRDQTGTVRIYNYVGGTKYTINLLYTSDYHDLGLYGWDDVNDGHEIV